MNLLKLTMYKIHLTTLFVTTPLLCLGNWVSFRGPSGNGWIQDKVPPTIETNSAGSWVRNLPGRGLSSPIIVNELALLTASSGPKEQNLHILAFSVKDGKLVWERKFKATGRTICHKKTCVAAPTMVSDGKVVIAQFSSNDLFCLDLQGGLKWIRGLTFDYPNIANGLGMSSSPVLAGGVLISQVENDADSFAFGINLESGSTLWRKNRPKGANWTSPIVLTKESTQWVGLQSKKGLTFLDPLTGESLWDFSGGASTIPSSAICANNSILVPSNGLTAFNEPMQNEATALKWKNNKLAPGTGSPSVSGNRLFVVNKANVLTCASIENGEIIWRLRLEGPVSASPICTDEHVFVFSENGLCQVVEIGEKEGKIVKTLALEDTILCTPAAHNGSIYVRSDKNLWKLSP